MKLPSRKVAMYDGTYSEEDLATSGEKCCNDIMAIGARAAIGIVVVSLAACGAASSPKATGTTPPTPPAAVTTTTTLPPATTTTTKPAVAHPNLRGEVIAAPAGFVLSASPGVHNGPFGVSGLATLLGIGPASSDPSGDIASASQLHLVSGYQVTYDSSTGMGGIEISLIDLATSSDTDYFRHALGLALGNDSNGVTSADATIPGATDFNATQATKGKGYDHLVVASKANRAMVVNYISGSGASVPLLANLAEQQYERL